MDSQQLCGQGRSNPERAATANGRLLLLLLLLLRERERIERTTHCSAQDTFCRAVLRRARWQ